MVRNLKRIIYLIFLVTCIQAKGSNLSVSAKLDSVNVLMGNLNTLHLEVVEDKGLKGRFPIFDEMSKARGYATVCGDSVELSANYNVDTTELGSGKTQINYAIPVQVFDSGTYRLPKFVYLAGNDSAETKSLTFNVYPVNVTSEDAIAGFAPIQEPDGKRFYDWIPDWLLDFWWVWLIIFLAICVFLWGMRNFKKAGIPFITPKELPKPWVIALESLQRLKNRKLWEQGLEKEYFTDLTDILRVYLYERFEINAMEMTSSQILEKIQESDLRDKKNYVNQILKVADFVKFAKVRPMPEDSITAYDNAVKFVEETIPEQAPAGSESEDSEEESEEGGED